VKAPKCCGKKMTAFAADTNGWDTPHVFFQCKKCKNVELKDWGYEEKYGSDEEDEEDD